MTIEIELTRTADTGDLAQALSAKGFETDTPGSGCIRVEAADCTVVAHALESWAAERGLPFVPQHLDERHLVLSPPGS